LFESQILKIDPSFDLGERPRQKTGQSKTSQRCYILRTWEEAPEPICTAIYTVVVAPYAITYAKFRTEIFRGLQF